MALHSPGSGLLPRKTPPLFSARSDNDVVPLLVPRQDSACVMRLFRGKLISFCLQNPAPVFGEGEEKGGELRRRVAASARVTRPAVRNKWIRIYLSRFPMEK